MATREVNGNWFSENGWPIVDLAGCSTNPVPGTQANIPLQSGIPNTLMKAFAGRLNVYIESLNNDSGYSDEGGWTESNSVLGEPGNNDGSNHLGGTAMDLNWNDHPMGPEAPDPAAGWEGSQITNWTSEDPYVRNLLKYYTGDDGTQLIWWGNDWTSPHDSMHFQMGYNTYNNPAVQRWIDANIDSTTGMDKFPQWLAAQTNPPGPTPNPTPTPTPTDSAAQVLYDAVPEFEELPSNDLVNEIIAGLAASQCTNNKRIAMWLAQIGWESGGFVYTQEIQPPAGAAYPPYIGRTWIQITWESNYAAFGTWCVSQGLITDANQFVNNPSSLADPQWAGIGPAWYWTVERPDINWLCDNGDIVGVTQEINGGQNGIQQRTDRYNQAIALGDRLQLLIDSGATPVPPTPDPTPAPNPNDPAVPTFAEWTQLLADIAEIRAQLSGGWPQNGNDPAAAADLDKRKVAGDKLTLNDMVAWLKNHVSTHAKPTP